MTMNRPWRTSHPDYSDHVVPGVTGGGLPPMGDRLVDLILQGRKTTHRLVAVDPDVEPLHRGRSYAVARRSGQPAACKVIVADQLLERIRDLGPDDLGAEGFASIEDWRNWLAFVVLGLTSAAELDTDLHVWVIQFELDLVEHPLMLARQSQYGYTDKPSLALHEEMPVLDDVRETARRRWQRMQGEQAGGEVVTKPALELTPLELELRRLVNGRSGDPEDVAAGIHGRFPDVTPGEVRKIRRELGLRAIDGLEPFTEEETERMLTAMFAAGIPSVRDVCRVLDCSTTTARLVIKDRGSAAA